ncbi:MAG: hypothetical protein O2818_06240 [Bacteroidetes bacterium]|jgi:hypothetical protein|nr:hypothetical protein [Bacteroidota bacterium]
MKQVHFLTALAAVMLFASCSNSEMLIRKTQRTNAITDVNATGMVMRPLMADLDVDVERKQFEYSGDVKLPMADLRENAIAGFQQAHQCDYVVDASFETSRKLVRNVEREITITVSGLPARYTRIYQVDSLPKSVSQYARLMKDVQRVDYLNEITIKDNPIGLEFTTGNFVGMQVDFPLNLNGFETRGFVAIDGFLEDQLPNGVEVTINSSNNAETFTEFGYMEAANSLALGLMHQIPATKNINFRAVGGLNLNSYVFSDIADGGTYFGAASLLGLRIGGGLDFKIFRSIRGVGKIHKNLNGIRFISKVGSGDLDIENFEIDGANAWNLGLGLRFEF